MTVICIYSFIIQYSFCLGRHAVYGYTCLKTEKEGFTLVSRNLLHFSTRKANLLYKLRKMGRYSSYPMAPGTAYCYFRIYLPDIEKAIGHKPEDLDLTGNEMHVVYQQDISIKANTIDWDTGRADKRLRIGQPLTYYHTLKVDEIFPVLNKMERL